MSRLVVTFFWAGLFAGTAFAQAPKKFESDEIVIACARISPIARAALATSVTLLTRAQIESRATPFAADLLRAVPGLSVSRSGPQGGLTQIRMRGAEADQLLVLYGGVDMSDPFQGAFDFSSLESFALERIEVLRGAQSALYGSSAIGGLIHLVPRRGDGPLAFETGAEAGSFHSMRAHVLAQWGNDRADILLGGEHFQTGGSVTARNGTEHDGSQRYSLVLNGGVQLSDAFSLRALLRAADMRGESDPEDFVTGLAVDGDQGQAFRGLYGAVTGAYEGDALQLSLTYSFARARGDNFSFGAPSFSTDGTRDRISLAAATQWETGTLLHRVSAAADWTHETYRNLPIGPATPINDRRSTRQLGLAAVYELDWDDLSFSAALRHDSNERFSDATTYRVSLAWRHADSDTVLRIAAASGIKNPGNFELFGFDPGTFIGNPDLRPEQSEGIDAGLSRNFEDGSLSIGYFNTRSRDRITTRFLPGFLATPVNLDSTGRSQGVELTAAYWGLESLRFDAGYTYTDAVDDGTALIRIPRHAASLSALWLFDDERGELITSVQYTGTRPDLFFPLFSPVRVMLPAHVTASVSASYELSPAVRLTLRAENLFDARYEEVFSYRAPGLSVFGGIRASF